MELRQLKYFCAVVDHANFTRAAAACSVAQPSLSQQILNLEEELGQRLLVRHPRRVELTEAGESMLRHARAVLSECETLRSGMQRRSGRIEGTVAIGVIPTMGPFLLPTCLASFLELHPGVRIRLQESRTLRLIEELVAGRVDFAIASDITVVDRKRWSLHVRELFREPLLLALPRAHALARQAEAIGLEQVPRDQVVVLSDGHCLGEQVLRVCRLHRGEDRLECGQLETLLAMVAAGMGVGIVPEMATQGVVPEGLVIRRLRAPEPERTVSLVKRRCMAPTPAAQAFLDHFIANSPQATALQRGVEPGSAARVGRGRSGVGAAAGVNRIG